MVRWWWTSEKKVVASGEALSFIGIFGLLPLFHEHRPYMLQPPVHVCINQRNGTIFDPVKCLYRLNIF